MSRDRPRPPGGATPVGQLEFLCRQPTLEFRSVHDTTRAGLQQQRLLCQKTKTRLRDAERSLHFAKCGRARGALCARRRRRGAQDFGLFVSVHITARMTAPLTGINDNGYSNRSPQESREGWGGGCMCVGGGGRGGGGWRAAAQTVHPASHPPTPPPSLLYFPAQKQVPAQTTPTNAGVSEAELARSCTGRRTRLKRRDGGRNR